MSSEGQGISRVEALSIGGVVLIALGMAICTLFCIGMWIMAD